jgi:cellulose synthase/poly-beta-1,6-N-acetylglucosamine synthase-like glycosyltransferase
MKNNSKKLFVIILNKITGQYTHKLLIYSKETEALVGKGFAYKDKHFVHHSDLHHDETAFYNILPSQKVILFNIVVVILCSFLIDWHFTIVFLISALTILYFIDLFFNAFVIYRSLSSDQETQASKAEVDALTDSELPNYTVFCPLYKEWQVAPQFIEAMNRMDYPKDKLQIIFLLEENDRETIEKIASNNLESHFEIIVVPHSMPKTKPKAMNFGLKSVKGDLLVIYDAEDVPEVDQLKKAVIAFRKASPQTICIQAKLNFYNVKQNLLTRLFTAEYSLWFDLVLPGLQSLNAPIPLGGTSNHFKTEVLREVSGWDAFNVTEDCDLGIRLAKRGYRTAIVESTTYEEANSDTINWYNQRSRWIKGYIQSYMVHMRDPLEFIRKGSVKDFFIFQFVVGGKILSIFINPVMWLITIFYLLFRAKYGLFIESFFPTTILYIGITSFVLGNFLYLYYYMLGCAEREHNDVIKYVVFVPLYWLGMSIAAWKAVYEVIVKPHYWSKTIHGLHLKKPEMLKKVVS